LEETGHEPVITIYGSENCIWCLKAKQVAETFELKHEYKLVENCMAEFNSKFPDEYAVPQILWDNVHISGYEMFTKAVNEFIKNGENE
jgi:glutaredoxin